MVICVNCMLSRSIRCSTDKYFISILGLSAALLCGLPGLADLPTHWWTWGLSLSPSTPGSWFTPRTSSATRTARARPRSTSEPRAYNYTSEEKFAFVVRWVLTPVSPCPPLARLLLSVGLGLPGGVPGWVAALVPTCMHLLTPSSHPDSSLTPRCYSEMVRNLFWS